MSNIITVKENSPDLGTAPIGQLIRKLAIPTITAQLINMLYNIIDRIYIGNMPEVGKFAITGLGVTLPIIIFITAFSSLVGVSGAPLASIKMGQKDNKTAEKIMGNCFVMLCGLGVILTVVFLIFGHDLLMAFGASENTIIYAEPYLRIYSIGTIFVMLTMGMNNFITTQGFASMGMKTVIIGAILNIILDPIFIFVFDMGVQGAALATILSQAISCVWVLMFLFGKKTILKLKKCYFILDFKIICEVLTLGISPFIMMSTESLIQIVLNTGLYKFGGDAAVGAMTIIVSIMQFVMLPLQGLGQGAQPIISYNYGAGNKERVLKAFKLLFIISLAFATGVWAIAMLFPSILVSIFNRDPQLTELTVYGMRIYLATVFSMGAQLAVQQTLLALGRAGVSIFIALLRKVILLIPLALILPYVGNLGITGIFMSEPISDIISATTACILFMNVYKKLLK